MKNPSGIRFNLFRVSFVQFALALVLALFGQSQAQAANLIANPGFENSPPTAMGNNIGWPVTPWVLGGGNSSNVVQVDGPGGYDYFSNGPESDGSAPGAGVPQHYLDIANGSNDLYQSFTVPTCPASPAGASATVSFSGKFSTRAINIGFPSGPAANGKVKILSGTGTTGSVIASQTAALTAGPSKTSPWVTLSGTATVARGATFSYVVTMDDNVNFDDAVVTIDADPCDVKPPEGNGGQTSSCLKATPEISCGPRPGTYTITLHPQGVNGVVPSVLQVSTSTPGISLIPANASIAVVGGVAHVTVVGASPGQAISLDVMGSATGQGSSQGLDQCCNGKIEIVIPKDLDCDKPRVTIEKICEPAVLKPGPTDKPFYEAHCKIIVKSDSNITAPIHLTETPPAGGTISAITPPAPWVCSPAAPTSSPIGCDISPANFNALPGHVSTLDVVMSFNTNEGRPVNCASIDVKNPQSIRPWDEKHPNKACSPIKFPPHVKVEKTCEPAKKGQGHSFEAHCKITVTADGPATAPINISEVLSGAGQITAMSANPAATLCTPNPVVAAGTPVNCSIPAGPFNANGNSATIDVTVKFNTPGQAKEAKNCARLMDGLKHVPSCDDFRADDGKVEIIKHCDPTFQNGGAAPNSGPLFSVCRIKVVSTGPISGTVSFNEVLSGGTISTTVHPAGMSTPAGWVCTGNTCSIPGANLGANSVSDFVLVVTFPNAAAAQSAKNCAVLQSGGESCVPFTIGDSGYIELSKELFNQTTANLSGVIFDIDYNCGAPNIGTAHLPGNMGFGISTSGTCTATEQQPAVPAGNICPHGQTASWDIAYPNGQTVTGGTSGFHVLTVKNTLKCSGDKPKLEIVKTGLKECKPGVPCPFTISITSLGQPYSGNILLSDVLTPNLAWPVSSITPNICGAAITTMPFNCVANVNLAANTPFTFTATLNPLTVNELASDENCISAAVVGSNVPVGPMSAADVQNLANSGQLSTPVQSCWRFTVPPNVDSDMYVKKVVVNHAPLPLTGMVYDITSNCTNTTQPQGFAHFTDGQTIVFHHYEAGMSCTLSEVIPPTTACGALIPSWTTTYSPSQTVALSPNGETVTVTNTLDCKPIIVDHADKANLKIIKVAKYNGADIAPDKVLAPFPMRVDCDANFSYITNVTLGGGPGVLTDFPVGASCTVQEIDPPSPNIVNSASVSCGWNTSYSPAMPIVLPAGETTVTVTNVWECKPVLTGGGILSIKKEVISHAEMPLGPMQFSITANCTGNPTPALTQQLGDGETKLFQSFVPGTSCTVQEGPIGPTNACGLMTPQWTTEFIPPTALTNFQNGGMVTVRNTLDCICPHDQNRLGNKCVVSTVADPVCAKNQHLVNHHCVDNPLPPKCDAATATPAGDLCRCRFEHMTQTSKTACQCQQGYKLQAGRGCEKIIVRPNCKPPQVYNPATSGCITLRPVCKPPKVYNKATNSCVTPRPVCGPDQVYNAKRNACADVVKRCPPGTIKLRGACIAIPQCPRGTIAMPGTGICLPLHRKPQIDGPIEKPRGGLGLPGIPGL